MAVDGTRRPRSGELTTTTEKHVKAIYLFGGDEARVTGTRLARRMGVSAPTVSATVARLARDGFLVREARGMRLSCLNRVDRWRKPSRGVTKLWNVGSSRCWA